MSNLVFTGIFALLLILIAHVGLKLYVVEDIHVENLRFENDILNNENNKNNEENKVNKNLWNELTKNNQNTPHPMLYGPASAKTYHAHQGLRGQFNGVVPNYPVLATENEVHNLQESLKKDLAGFLNDHLLANKHQNNEIEGKLMNAPTGGPIIGRPTKQPYREIPMGVEERTYDGQYKSYENIMYGTDIEKYHKNDSINPYTNDGKYYAPYDKSPIIGH
jgi:hypothetical protein